MRGSIPKHKREEINLAVKVEERAFKRDAKGGKVSSRGSDEVNGFRGLRKRRSQQITLAEKTRK